MSKIINQEAAILSIATIILTIFLAFPSFAENKTEKAQDEQIEKKASAKIILYTKNGCGYCTAAKKLLQANNIPYEVTMLDGNQELISKLVDQTEQTTVPFVFIDDKFIGGYSDLKKLIDEEKI